MTKVRPPSALSIKLPQRAPHQVLVHVVRENDDWRIANVIYDSGKSLISHYRGIARS